MGNKRIKKPQHIRQILADEINRLKNGEKFEKIELEKARAIGYLSSIALTAMKDGDLEERITEIEKVLKERRSYE